MIYEYHIKRSIKRLLLGSFVFAFFLTIASVDEAKAVDGYNTFYNKAFALMQQQKYRAAERLLNSAIKKYPNVPKIIGLRARLMDYYLNRYDQAIADYTKVIKLTGKSTPKAYYRRGRCFDVLGLYQLAVRDYNVTLAIKPDYTRVYLIRAKAYNQLGLRSMALRDTLLFIKARPGDHQGPAFLKKLLNVE